MARTLSPRVSIQYKYNTQYNSFHALHCANSADTVCWLEGIYNNAQTAALPGRRAAVAVCQSPCAGIYDQNQTTYAGQDNIFVVVPAKKSPSDAPSKLDFVANTLKEHLPGLHWYHPHK
jgi:hypothetical protein